MKTSELVLPFTFIVNLFTSTVKNSDFLCNTIEKVEGGDRECGDERMREGIFVILLIYLLMTSLTIFINILDILLQLW